MADVYELTGMRAGRDPELHGWWIVALVVCLGCGRVERVMVVPAWRQWGLECRGCGAMAGTVERCWLNSAGEQSR